MPELMDLELKKEYHRRRSSRRQLYLEQLLRIKTDKWLVNLRCRTMKEFRIRLLEGIKITLVDAKYYHNIEVSMKVRIILGLTATNLLRPQE